MNKSINIFKEWNRNPDAWCSCCGKRLPIGTETVRITANGSPRIVSKTHFIAWLENDGQKFLPFCYPEEAETKI